MSGMAFSVGNVFIYSASDSDDPKCKGMTVLLIFIFTFLQFFADNLVFQLFLLKPVS